MDTDTFEQISVNNDFLDDTLDFIEEGQNVELLMYEGAPISIELPTSVILEVKSSEDAIKGDTATNVTKSAILSTGLSVQVPLFIKEGDKIKVDTRTKEYIERDNS